MISTVKPGSNIPKITVTNLGKMADSAHSARNVSTGFVDAALKILCPTTIAETANRITTETKSVLIDAGR